MCLEVYIWDTFFLFQISQTIVPAGTSLEQTGSRISKTKTESPKSATSPQVTEMAEEELAEDQPKPVYVINIFQSVLHIKNLI